MATRNTTSRSSGSGAKTNVTSMLKADHKKVKKAFKDFEKLDPQEDPEGCQALVQQTLGEVEVHAEIEERIFYPAARGAIKEEDLVDEAEVEHMTAKVLIEQLKGMRPDDQKYAATFKVLGEYLNHHIREEEEEMFKKLTASGAEWDSVLEQMQAQRQQLMEEKGLPAETDSSNARSMQRRESGSGDSPRGRSESRPQAAGKGSRSSTNKG